MSKIPHEPSLDTLKSYSAPEEVDWCRSVWYVGGEKPRKAGTLLPSDDGKVKVQFEDNGQKRQVGLDEVRLRNTWTDDPIEP